MGRRPHLRRFPNCWLGLEVSALNDKVSIAAQYRHAGFGKEVFHFDPIFLGKSQKNLSALTAHASVMLIQDKGVWLGRIREQWACLNLICVKAGPCHAWKANKAFQTTLVFSALLRMLTFGQ